MPLPPLLPNRWFDPGSSQFVPVAVPHGDCRGLWGLHLLIRYTAEPSIWPCVQHPLPHTQRSDMVNLKILCWLLFMRVNGLKMSIWIASKSVDTRLDLLSCLLDNRRVNRPPQELFFSFCSLLCTVQMPYTVAVTDNWKTGNTNVVIVTHHSSVLGCAQYKPLEDISSWTVFCRRGMSLFS